jgi:methyl-accepting chemotaxis protein
LRNLRIRILLRYSSIVAFFIVLLAAVYACWSMVSIAEKGQLALQQQTKYFTTAVRAGANSAAARDFTATSDALATDLGQAGKHAVWVMVFCVCCVVLAVAAVNTYVTKLLVVPIRSLIGAAEAISKGDVSVKIEHTELQNEIGKLARTFDAMTQYLRHMAHISDEIAHGNLTIDVSARSEKDVLSAAFATMIENLRTMATAVRDAASQVASSAAQVRQASQESAQITVASSAAVEDVSSTVHEMNTNSRTVLKNTERQRVSVRAASGDIENMSDNAARVADEVVLMQTTVRHSQDQIQQGTELIREAAVAMRDIDESIRSTSELIGALSGRIANIGHVLDVIEDIADQTNLLALNAAIEAARAGEHGLGFAVVADEVRKLAEKSLSATDEISELVSAIQACSSEAVQKMEDSATKASRSIDRSAQVDDALLRINSAVGEFKRHVNSIVVIAQEQATRVAQIAKSTAQLNDTTEEIGASIEEQVNASEAIFRSVEKIRPMVRQSSSTAAELAASSDQMSRMAETLTATVESYNVDTPSSTPDFGARSTRRSRQRAFAAAGSSAS